MQAKTKKKHERDYTEAIGNEAEMSKYLNKILKTKGYRHIKEIKRRMHRTRTGHTKRTGKQTLPITYR